MMRASRGIIAAGAALLALCAQAPVSARAQAGGSVWVSLDGRPAGTPASVTLDPERSSPSETWIDVLISGFYVTSRSGPDATVYQDIDVPGLPSTTQPGAPRTPVVRIDLGVLTDAVGSTLIGVEGLDLRSFPGYTIWPSPIPAQLHGGAPSQFVRDSTIYASASDFPAGDGHGTPKRPTIGGLPASRSTMYPVHWNPATGTLTVAARASYGFGHAGGFMTMDLTVEHNNAAASALFNWGSIQPAVSVNWTQFQGAYLFVVPQPWLSDLMPLIQEKKTRGFSVTISTVSLSGLTCAQLRQRIQSWYAATPAGFDHYALLVGSAVTAPYCVGPDSQLTDKLLSSVAGDDESEIYLGRLWVSSQAELQNQVKKIFDYETGPQVNNDGHVLLVAHHQQDQDFNFQSYQESIRNAAYAQVTPSFVTCYGTNPSLGNADISNDIGNGVGVVAYSGHGEDNRWDRWSGSNQSYTNSDASSLSNGALTPVIWSIACQTGDPREPLSLANGFMKNTQGGAVAFYGAVDPTYGWSTVALEDTLFQAVYGRGVTRHGLAIAMAEHAAVLDDSLFGYDAMRKYILYGDPEMSIRRQDAFVTVPLDVYAPLTLFTPCPGAGCCPSCGEPVVDIQIRDVAGAPVPGVKVALWKPRFDGSDEILANRYSGPDGWAHIPASGVTRGTLFVGWDDGDGRAGLDSIAVQSDVTGAAVENGTRPYRLAATPSVTRGAVRFTFGRMLERPARVLVFGVDGRLVRVLRAARGASDAIWDGRNQAGRLAAPGVYFARAEGRLVRGSTRVVVVR